MATKRSTRIDPNAAFAAIVGTAEADMPTPMPMPEALADTAPPAATARHMAEAPSPALGNTPAHTGAAVAETPPSASAQTATLAGAPSPTPDNAPQRTGLAMHEAPPAAFAQKVPQGSYPAAGAPTAAFSLTPPHALESMPTAEPKAPSTTATAFAPSPTLPNTGATTGFAARPPAAESAAQAALAQNPAAVPANVQPPLTATEGDACTVTPDAAIDAIGAAAMASGAGSLPHPATRPPAAESAAQQAVAVQSHQAGVPLPNRQSAMAAAATAAQPDAAAPRLVQKGYYITEEQHKCLGMLSVMQGTDRSFIVRKALDLYFDAHQDLL